MFTLDDSVRTTRCPCCRKKTVVTMGHFFQERPVAWDNWMGRAAAATHAAEGICPWCGKRTTIVARILKQRFEPLAATIERQSW